MKAFLTLELQDGTKFRWGIPEKYAWKIFLERWAPRKREKPKEKEEDGFEQFRLD